MSLMHLFDQFANKIKPKDLTAIVAGPSDDRKPLSDHPTEGMTPTKLADLHKKAEDGDTTAYLDLAEDIEERDPHYHGVISTRKRSIAQLPIHIEAASDDPKHIEHADFLRKWLKTGVLNMALFDVLDAIGKGFSVMEIEWLTTPEKVVPKKLIYRPQRWFAFDETDRETILLKGENGAKLPLAPHKFIIHRHPAKSGLTIRSGIARVASWSWMYKSFTLKDWAIFVQNYGMPIRLGKFGRESTADERSVLWRAISSLAGSCAAIVPASMQIEFIEMKDRDGKADLYERRADWLDRQTSKAVLGQTTTTDAVSGGHAVAKEHRQVQEDIETSDAALLSNTLTNQLVPLIIALNFGPQDEYPFLTVGRVNEVPLELIIEALKGVPGLKVELSQLLDRLGFTEAAEGAEIVGMGSALGSAALSPEMKEELHTLRGLKGLRTFVTRHARQETNDVARLTERLALDASGALGGMTNAIREIFENATDLHDAAAKLAALDLDDTQFVEAMTRGLTLSHLAGQAALLDELDHG